jgi:hypothetical protein
MSEIIVEIPLTFSFSSRLGDVIRTRIAWNEGYRIRAVIVSRPIADGLQLKPHSLKKK